MPGSPATSPVFGAPRYTDGDDATFSEQVNSVTDTFDALAVRTDDLRLSDARNPLPGSVTGATIPNAAITGAKLAPQTIAQANMSPSSIGSPEIIDNSIANVDLATNAVDTRVIAVGGVLTPNLGDGQVTTTKLVAAVQQALNAPGDLIFSAASTRAGAVLCDGKAYSRSDPVYAALFAAIGTSYGAGNGSTTFNVPNYLGRTLVAAGQGTGLTNRVLGALFGEEAHTLSAYEMPSHAHAISDSGHAHGVADPGHAHGLPAYMTANADPNIGNVRVNLGTAYNAPWNNNSGFAAVGGTNNAGTGIGIYAATTGIAIQTNGNSGPHNNIQPSAAVNVFVKL